VRPARPRVHAGGRRVGANCTRPSDLLWDRKRVAVGIARQGDSVKCILRESPDAGEALKPLGASERPHRAARAGLFALAHEVGHCKLREAFLSRSDASAADASVSPGCPGGRGRRLRILSVERNWAQVPCRHGHHLPHADLVHVPRPNHATGHYVSNALDLCTRTHRRHAVACAIATAYYTVGSLATTTGIPYASIPSRN